MWLSKVLMRNLRYYLISVAIHAAVLGVLAWAATWHVFTAPQFALRAGGGSGGDGLDAGDAVVLEGELLPCSQPPELHINPAPRRHAEVRSELIDAQTVESGRLTPPSVETQERGRRIEVPVPQPPPLPPPAPAARVAALAAEQVEPPSSPPERHPQSSVDIGELMRGSSAAKAAAASGEGPPGSRHGSAGGQTGGGGGDGLPTGASGNIRPPYPSEALARGSEGVVTLRVVVDENGAVRSANVETSSGDASLDQSALTTVRDRWHFEPAHRDGAAVECEVLVPIRFRLRAGG